MSLPHHGKLSCVRCFKSCDTKLIQPHPLWLLKNDPGAWGGSKPNVLVLGFSKGSTQADIYESGTFEDVAFGGQARNRLDTVLKQLNLLGHNEHVSNEIANPNSRFSFGSMIRCSLTREDKNGIHASSGDLVIRSFKEVPHIFDNCTEQFLSNLPQDLSLVIMLGISEKYIFGCFDVFKKLYPELQRLNNVSYGFGDKTFVHVAHPSPANGHFNDWFKGNSKFVDALSIIKQRVGNKKLLTASKEKNSIPIEAILSHEVNNEVKILNNKPNVTLFESAQSTHKSREARIPVSTIATNCVPFNRDQKGTKGYEIGENPVKGNGQYFDNFNEALYALNKMKNPGWRAHGKGPGKSNGGARKAIGWVTDEQATQLLAEKDNDRRVRLYKSFLC
jgi:hypothetical protein